MRTVKNAGSKVSYLALATVLVTSCDATDTTLPPISNICGGQTSHYVMPSNTKVPKLANIGVFGDLKFERRVISLGKVGKSNFRIENSSTDDADILVVPSSSQVSRQETRFAVQATEIVQGEWALDNNFPISHLRARELIFFSKIANSTVPNSEWAENLNTWRVQGRTTKMMTFFPLQRPSGQMGVASILFFSPDMRKVICFIEIDTPKILAREYIKACVAVMYGYLGPELDYSNELSRQEVGNVSKIDECLGLVYGRAKYSN